MVILNNAIARICSISKEEAKFLHPTNSFLSTFKSTIERYVEIEKVKEDLLVKLHDINSQIDDKSINNAIQNIRRNLHNNKAPKQKDLQKIEHLEHVYDEVTNYQNINSDFDSLNDLEVLYNEDIFNKRQNIYELVKNPLIKNGLLLSSQDLLEALNKYDPKTNNKNKKFKQTEIGILKYLTRSVFKPTPFSSFTQLNNAKITKFDNNESNLLIKTSGNKKVKSFIRVNNRIFQLLRIILFYNKDIYGHFEVQLNPSLELKTDSHQFKFLINKNNYEFFRYLEKNSVLELIYNYLKTTNCLTFNEIKAYSINQVDANEEDIHLYLKKLIDYGFIEFNLNISGTDIDWIDKLQIQISRLPFSETQNRILSILNNLKSARNDFENSFNNDVKRNEILNRIYSDLNSRYRDLYIEAFPEKRDKINLETYRIIKKENIFLEDTICDSLININLDIVEPITKRLNRLIQYGHSLGTNSISQIKLYNFFKKNYRVVDEVKLLDLYEDYYKFLKSKEKPETEIIKADSISSDGSIKFELNHLNIENNSDELCFKIHDSVITKNISNNFSSSSFFQVAQNETGGYYFITNGIGYGYGKMSSRFLYMFKEDFLEEIMINNKRLSDNKYYSEVNDSSYFNANLHPPLFEFECKIPGGHTNVQSNFQLEVNNLYVILDEKCNKLRLFDRKSSKEVIVHDSCFQGMKGRSELFNLLLCFSDNIPSNYGMILKNLNIHFKKKVSDNLIFYPRIIYETNIVLQRKHWLVFNLDALTILPNESEIEYMLRINLWLKKNDIPAKAFITLNYNRDAKKKNFKRDDYKPQYVEFDNPLFIPLISKIFKNNLSYKITELLPSKDDLVNFEDNSFTVEFLTQWYNGKSFQ